MKVVIEPGKYVVAVSGGVDSVVLLNLLSKLPDIDLVVAHFNHGIRDDSVLDEEFVESLAKKYRLPFESDHGKLGASASEETARNARYEFLESVRAKHKAQAIVTAHHQDDLVETALLNVLRGSGRRGLVAIAVNKKITRPLLGTPKKQILEYARQHKLEWREDSSNQDKKYLRNRVRQKLIPKISATQRQKLLKDLNKLANNHKDSEELLDKLSQKIAPANQIDRQQFIALPSNVAAELVVFWMRKNGVIDFDKKMVERIAMAIKTAKAGTTHQIKNGLTLGIEKDYAILVTP